MPASACRESLDRLSRFCLPRARTSDNWVYIELNLFDARFNTLPLLVIEWCSYHIDQMDKRNNGYLTTFSITQDR
jgi:hypothetical protein